MMHELWELWVHRDYTPVQSISMLVAYVGFVALGGFIGYQVARIRSRK